MENETYEQTSPVSQLKSYAANRLRLVRLQATAKGTAIAADVIIDIAVLICYLLIFLFASLMLGYFLAEFLGSGWAGFGCLTLVYLLVSVLIPAFKKQFEKQVINTLLVKISKK
jgi:hypothetical protein